MRQGICMTSVTATWGERAQQGEATGYQCVCGSAMTPQRGRWCVQRSDAGA